MIKPKLEIEKSGYSAGLGITTLWTTFDQTVIIFDEPYCTFDGGIGEQFSNRQDIPLKLEVIESPRPKLAFVE